MGGRVGPQGEIFSPGPASYSPRGDRTSNRRDLLSQDCARASQVRALKPRERTLYNPSGEGPGPAAYSPRGAGVNAMAGEQHVYSVPRQPCRPINGPIQFGDAPEVTPGPAYHPKVKDRKGGGMIGDGPAYSISNSNCAKRFVSKSHEKAMFGTQSPGPQVYTPREQFGVVDFTTSNTGVHAPSYSFGTEERPCGRDPRKMLAQIKEKSESGPGAGIKYSPRATTS